MNAKTLKKRRLATIAVRPVTSRASAPRLRPQDHQQVDVEDSAVVLVEVRNATSVERSDTLPATAQKVDKVDSAVSRVAGSAVNRVDTEVVRVVHTPAVVRLATHAVDTVTCLATAPRVRSATTVSPPPTTNPELTTNPYSGGEVGHVSRDCPTEAKGERMCYKCKQPGHVQSACPN